MRATARSMASAKRLRRQLSLPRNAAVAAATRKWPQAPLPQAARNQSIRRRFPLRAAKTVIEIDGAIHNGRQDTDGTRDAYMASLGISVIRIPAAEVLADPEAVADGIYRLCEDAPGPSTTQPRG